MNFCKDCKYHSVHESETVGERLCGATAFDPVTGAEQAPTNCYTQRGRNGLCGPLGVLFEEAQAEVTLVDPEGTTPPVSAKTRKPRAKKAEVEPTEGTNGE